MARAFVAVVPPEPVLDAVAATADELRSRLGVRARARWAPRDQWHLTLRFLGDDVDLDGAAAHLRDARFTPFDVALGGVGAFSRPSRAAVLWIGVSQGCAALTALAGTVTSATAGIAPVDDEPFRPHLTVARFAKPADVRSVVHRPDGERIGAPWRVAELVLMESVLGKGPVQHRVHARVGASTT